MDMITCDAWPKGTELSASLETLGLCVCVFACLFVRSVVCFGVSWHLLFVRLVRKSDSGCYLGRSQVEAMASKLRIRH